jgi:hypothetical protein
MAAVCINFPEDSDMICNKELGQIENCSPQKLQVFDPVYFSFEEAHFPVPLSDVLRQQDELICAPFVSDHGFILGSPFLKYYYTVYDMGRK